MIHVLALSMLVPFASGRLLSAADDLQLPPLLRLASGEGVDSPDLWTEQRRGEILELFRQHVYGRAPVDRPETLRFTVSGVDPRAMDGAATRKLVTIAFAGPGGDQAMQVVVFVPNDAPRPVPAFLLICNRPAENIDPDREHQSPFWPAGRGDDRP